MEKIQLQTQPRNLTVKPKSLLKQSVIPAIIYGQKIKSQPLQVKKNDFTEAFKKAGLSHFVDLTVDKKTPVKVLIHEVQREPVSGDYLHIDFYQVRMDKKITTEVPLKFTGVSKAVKEQGGILVKNITDLEITCLPDDLPSLIEVDISKLNKFEDSILIKDLKLDQKLEIDTDLEEVVVTVDPPRSEEELKELEEEAEADVDQVEVTKEKPEEEGEEAETEAGETKEGEKKAEGTKPKPEKAADFSLPASLASRRSGPAGGHSKEKPAQAQKEVKK